MRTPPVDEARAVMPAAIDAAMLEVIDAATLEGTEAASLAAPDAPLLWLRATGSARSRAPNEAPSLRSVQLKVADGDGADDVVVAVPVVVVAARPREAGAAG